MQTARLQDLRIPAKIARRAADLGMGKVGAAGDGGMVGPQDA